MIVTDPAEFLKRARALPARVDLPLTMRAALLVAPADFHVVPEASPDNLYIDSNTPAGPGAPPPVDSAKALAQHEGLARELVRVGVPVITMPGVFEQPDGVFPNNAYGTTPGRIIVGSMAHPARRAESQRGDIRDFFTDLLGYEMVDLGAQDCIAELTGVLVIDHLRNIGYCGMTQRVNEAGCRAMHSAFDLDLTFRFDLNPDEYHTNVVLSVLAGRACVIDPSAFQEPAVPAAIQEFYGERTLVLSESEESQFVGNCLAVTPRHVFMSRTAEEALRKTSREALEAWGFRVQGVDVGELEKAGGSLRCLIAEVY